MRADHDVLTESSTPAIGAQAPSVDTPTATDVGGDLARLSTDREPEPRLYQTSIADAVAAGEPFVVAFATPAFCETADATGELQPAPWTEAWGLLTEPFVAVVDASGAVRAKFEGTIAPEELQAHRHPRRRSG